MRTSLLSSLKIVAMMLAVDKEIHLKEKAWFFVICRNYGVSFREKLELSEYLNGRSSQSLEEIIRDIVEEEDRRRLLNFVQMAMRQDGLVKNTEIELFYRIKKGLEPNLRNDYVELGRALREREKELIVWEQLEKLGKAFSQPVRPWFGYSYYINVDIWYLISYLIESHKLKIITSILIIAAVCYLIHLH
ncbi:hypothetical protein DOM22_06615 [Bdellovibrio sp. ZAP7]|uniref:hypothetical protein n=1 Tax=Bdellovibrio sp. ZAP7 TaxID=2231053 RepID=UPI0011657B3B|nr:hypothetical protein [Bdellovibrio sp. ZAP7]QDK44856.1 hypothetical protein DOM22_06615 [Bdellovibrio sp. ZAP7]